jgi:hypothetical protein
LCRSGDGTQRGQQERCNWRIARPRARVEHFFAGTAQLGRKVLRSIDLARTTLRLNWKAFHLTTRAAFAT